MAIGASNNKYIKIISDSPTLLILKEKKLSPLFDGLLSKKNNETAARIVKK